ncbi:ATP-dependent DNA helicase RecG [Escherichia coli]|uniref:ATP-dependent DNA helicase RecG n=1 Tax=Escherichia coli TaxID=562 RepID=A0A376ML14_ECOLX|nr:ATP-dependent DNA helicase RecG [Escherichia coli]
MLSHSVSLTGVGAALSNKLAKINLHTVQDLLLHLPLRYEDRTHLYPIGELLPVFMPRWKAKC